MSKASSKSDENPDSLIVPPSTNLRRSSRTTKGKHSRFEREEELLGAAEQSPPSKRHNTESKTVKEASKLNSGPNKDEGGDEKEETKIDNDTIDKEIKDGAEQVDADHETSNSSKKKKSSSNRGSGRARASKAKDKTSGSSKETEGQEEENEENSSDGIVSCICGATEDDGELMVECEKCLKWQHSSCMLEIDDADKLPDHYFCHTCRPDLYPNIDILTKNAIENAKKPPSRRRRSSTKKTVTNTKSSQIPPLPSPTASNSPSQQNVPNKTGKSNTGATPTKPESKPTRVSARLSTKKRKLEAETEKENVPLPTDSGLKNSETSSISDLPKTTGPDESDSLNIGESHTNQQDAEQPINNIEDKNSKRSYKKLRTNGNDNSSGTDTLRNSARKTAVEALRNILSKSTIPKTVEKTSFEIKSPETIETLAENLSVALEEALYQEFADKDGNSSDVGPRYRSNFRIITSIFKDDANNELHRRLVTSELKPNEFVTMEQEDRMNPTLKKFAESVRAESTRNAILKVDDGPRIRRTHKGEEYITDEQSTNNSFSDNQIPTASELITSFKGDSKASSKDAAIARKESESLDKIGNSNEPVAANKNGLWGNGESIAISTSHMDIASVPDEISENDIDIDVDDEYLASSTNSFWSGSIFMDTITEFPVKAIHLCGPPSFDPSRSWPTIMSMDPLLLVEGRLPSDRAASYLKEVGKSKDIISMIIRTNEDGVSPSQPRGERPKFKALFEYFSTRQKFGVFKKEKPAVKDSYLITLEEGQEIPDYLLLSEEARALLEHFLYKDKRVILGVFVTRPQVQPIQSLYSPISSDNPHGVGQKNTKSSALTGALAAALAATSSTTPEHTANTAMPPATNTTPTTTLQDWGFSNSDFAMIQKLAGGANQASPTLNAANHYKQAPAQKPADPRKPK